MYLTVDPGINAAGFALWSETEWNNRRRPALPELTWIINYLTGESAFDYRVKELMDQLDQRIAGEAVKVTGVFTEMPVMFGGAVGQAVARRGDLTHLAYAVGSLAEWARGRGARFRIYPVNEWIGQLPKDVMQRRVRDVLRQHYDADEVDDRLGRGKPSHHWDAVGIGLYAQGFFQ